jgi:long-chain acyl-CoA synthetase
VIGEQAQPMMLERLMAAADASPLRPALWFGGRSITYRQLQRHVQRTAQALAYSGLTPGKTLALVLPTGPAVVIYSFAAHACGAAIALFDPSIGADGLTNGLKACGARFAVTLDQQELLERGQHLLAAQCVDRILVVSRAAHLPFGPATARRFVALLRGGGPAAGTVPGLVYERDVLREVRRAARDQKASPKENVVVAPIDPAAVAVQLVTQLSDGHRIASLTQAMIAASVDQLTGSLPLLVPEQERVLALVLVSSPVAIAAALNLAVAKAGQLICVPDVTQKNLLNAIKRTRPTLIVGNSAQLAAMAAHSALGPAHFSDLKLILNLDWDKPSGLLEALARLSSAPVLSCYAIDSVGAVVAIGSTGLAQPPTAVGRVVSHTKLVVRDLGDLQRVVGPGERGELCVGGPQIVTPHDLTRVHMGGGGGDDDRAFVDGLLRTGDLGAVDLEGNVFLVDRIEDMIVAAGYLIYPRRIEAALREYPGVENACVIGIGDKRRGQAPKAFVVLKRGIAVTERDLRLHLASRVSKIEMPSDIDFCTALPSLPSGTVDKARLRAQALAQNQAR